MLTPTQPNIKGKALSLKQPWAWAIFHGKPVENRTWYSNYRGPLWIHSSRTVKMEDYQFFIENKISYGWLYYGAIIGRVNMVDCVKEHDSWWFFGPYGFVFEDPIILGNPIPYKGQLRIFDVDTTPPK